MIMIIRYSIDKWISQTVNMYYSENLVLISRYHYNFKRKVNLILDGLFGKVNLKLLSVCYSRF